MSRFFIQTCLHAVFNSDNNVFPWKSQNQGLVSFCRSEFHTFAKPDGPLFKRVTIFLISFPLYFRFMFLNNYSIYRCPWSMVRKKSNINETATKEEINNKAIFNFSLFFFSYHFYNNREHKEEQSSSLIKELLPVDGKKCRLSAAHSLSYDLCAMLESDFDRL